MVQLSHPYMTTGKALTIHCFVSKIISLLFNMLSRFVIVFLPRSKRLRNDQFSSVAQSYLTLCDLMNCDAIQPSHPLLSPSSPAFLQSFPASGSFPMSWLFESGGQSIGVWASASVLPMTQDWFPLRLTDWISLQCKGLLRVFFTYHLDTTGEGFFGSFFKM